MTNPAIEAVRLELALLQASNVPIGFAARKIIAAVLDNLPRAEMALSVRSGMSEWQIADCMIAAARATLLPGDA